MILFLSTELHAFETIKNMPSRNIYFTGRELYLNDIQKILLQHGRVYLTGYGGIGKSQLAKEYSYINEQNYDLVWWFDLRSDLVMQYESLLIHLSNSKKFKNQLRINVNNIAPNVLVDFINSLLLDSDCKWLLIFDNVLDIKKIKLPKNKPTRHHIIITTREKSLIGDNVLTLRPFTSNESEKFLSKIHPKEKKEKIAKLYKALCNYPLALAQVSEEILMYKNGIDSYFKRRDNHLMESISMNSDITQEYDNSYRDVLNLTLQDIEQKDKELAKVLYMLSLLNIDLTKEFLKDLFGDEIEGKIIALSKYGVIQTTEHVSYQINIHDIIKEEAVRRLNGKETSYKKEVVRTLVEHFKNFYSKKDLQYLSGLDAANYNITSLYAFIDIALQNDVVDENVIEAIILALRLNNILFNKNANPVLYQQLVNKISNKNLDNITSAKKALLYANLIICSSVFESKETIPKFEKEMLHLVGLIEKQKNNQELFLIYTNISLFYVFIGDFKEAKKYANMAKEIISDASDIFILLQYWYMEAWLCYELRDVEVGLKALDSYIQLSNSQHLSPIGLLFAKSLKVGFRSLIGQGKEAIEEIDRAIKDALKYYNGHFSRILGELEYTKSFIYFRSKQYKLAERQCHRAFDILTKIFCSKDIKELPQAHIYVMLGYIYEEKGNYKGALEKYGKAIEFYNKNSCRKVNSFYEYGELLSNLCAIYYKQKNYVESKFYFQKLIANFDLEHDIVGKLIKKLPRDYVFQIRDNTKK